LSALRNGPGQASKSENLDRTIQYRRHRGRVQGPGHDAAIQLSRSGASDSRMTACVDCKRQLSPTVIAVPSAPMTKDGWRSIPVIGCSSSVPRLSSEMHTPRATARGLRLVIARSGGFPFSGVIKGPLITGARWRRVDSNYRQSDYEPLALPLSYVAGQNNGLWSPISHYKVAGAGLEPATFGL
jgi:hypothetical protein